MPKDYLFPPLLGTSRVITLTADVPVAAEMLGAIVSLAGFDLAVSAITGYGFFIVVGPGNLTGDIEVALTGNQAIVVTLVDGVFFLVDQPEIDLAAITAHIANLANPHAVTKTQVGLGNVNNTSDANKPVSIAQAAADAAVLSTANADATTKANGAQTAAIAAAAITAQTKADAAQAAASLDATAKADAAQDAATAAASADATAKANAVAAAASLDATAKANAAQSAANSYTDSAIAGMSSSSGLPVVIVPGTSPRPGIASGISISGLDDENYNELLLPGVGVLSSYPAIVRDGGPWWSSDGNPTRAATGYWKALSQRDMVAVAATTLDLFMPPGLYFVGTLAALTFARGGGGGTTDFGTNIRIGADDYILVDDGGPKWVLFSDETNADQGSLVIAQGDLIYLFPLRSGVVQGFVAGLAQTWANDPSTQWKWMIIQFVDGATFRKPQWTATGTSADAATWGISPYSTGTLSVTVSSSVPDGIGLGQFLRYGDAPFFDWYIWDGYAWSGVFTSSP